MEDYMDTVKRIEPDVHPLDRDGALASIAISLKRIADSLEMSNESGLMTIPRLLLPLSKLNPENLSSAVSQAIFDNHGNLTNLAWEMGRSFAAGNRPG